MRLTTPLLSHDARRAGAWLALAAALVASAPAQAERGDRTKPMTVDSSGPSDVVDLSKHSAVFAGNVVITQGTLVIHADKVEVSEDPDGQRLGSAYGTPGHPATFRQKRDGGDDLYSEGEADRIVYDSATNRVHFIGSAHLRMLNGNAVTDSASAGQITYDTAAETFLLSGDGTQSTNGSTTTTNNGRTTVVFTPKQPSSAPKRAPEAPLALPAPAASGAAR